MSNARRTTARRSSSPLDRIFSVACVGAFTIGAASLGVASIGLIAPAPVEKAVELPLETDAVEGPSRPQDVARETPQNPAVD